MTKKKEVDLNKDMLSADDLAAYFGVSKKDAEIFMNNYGYYNGIPNAHFKNLVKIKITNKDELATANQKCYTYMNNHNKIVVLNYDKEHIVPYKVYELLKRLTVYKLENGRVIPKPRFDISVLKRIDE